MLGGLEEALGTLHLLELAGQARPVQFSPKDNFTVNHARAARS